MTLEKIWETYAEYTKSASDTARPLCLAGIAIIWLFKVDATNGIIQIDRCLLMSGALFVAALALDLLHFIAGVTVFGLLGSCRERLANKKAQDADYSGWTIFPIELLFWGKLIAVVVGYCFLIAFFAAKLQPL